METKPTPQNLSQSNPQTQSPLFSTIPAEIRNQIFSLALTPHEDLTNPYPEHDFCYRPDHRARRILSTALLLTCRRIWLEANHLPMEQTVHSFWFDSGRRPPWVKGNEYKRIDRLVGAMTPTQLSHGTHLHFFAQMYWLERRSLVRLLAGPSYQPLVKNMRSLTITIRYSDWWNWESNEPLRISTIWMKEILSLQELRRVGEIRLELEVLERQMGQLKLILDRLAGVAGPDGRFQLVGPHEESTWSGPTNLGGRAHAPYKKLERMDYRVVTVKWKQTQSKLDEASDGEGSSAAEEGALNRENSEMKIDTETQKTRTPPAQSRNSHSQRDRHERPFRSCRWRKERSLLKSITLARVSKEQRKKQSIRYCCDGCSTPIAFMQ